MFWEANVRSRLESSGNHSDQRESRLYKQIRALAMSGWDDEEIEMDVKRSKFDRGRRTDYVGALTAVISYFPRVFQKCYLSHLANIAVLYATTATGDIPLIKSAESLMTGNNPMKYRRMLTRWYANAFIP